MAALRSFNQMRNLCDLISKKIVFNISQNILFSSRRNTFVMIGRNFSFLQESTSKNNENFSARSPCRKTKQILTNTSSVIRKYCRQGDFKKARELLDDLFIVHEIHSLTKCYNCIMYHYVKYGHFEECLKFKSEMMMRKIPMDDSSYYILASLYAKYGFVKEGKEVIEEMRLGNNKASSRIYSCLIIASATRRDMRTAFELFSEMKKSEKVRCDTCYASVISAAADHEDEIWREKAFAIIKSLKGQNSVGSETLSSIKHFFESDKKKAWRVQEAEIESSGKCLSCGQQLETGKLSETEHVQLKYQLGSRWQDIMAWSPKKNMRCFTSVGNYIDTPSDVVDGVPRSVAHFIQTTGPYDVVIDALNVGYKHAVDSTEQVSTNRFKPEQVKQVASHFLKDGKRVLVIGGKPMTFDVLRKNHVNQFRKALKSSLIYLQENCGVMLVVDSFTLPGLNKSRFRLLDDLHILCAAMHCGPDTQLVSGDKFADHVGHLDQKSRSAFRRWYRLNQIRLETFVKGIPVFKKEPPFNPVVQVTNESSWHFPSEAAGKWMCAKVNFTNKE